MVAAQVPTAGMVMDWGGRGEGMVPVNAGMVFGTAGP